MSSTLGLVVLITMFVLAVGAVTLAEMSSPVLSLEAEQAQLAGQFTIGDDPLASGGQYVSVEGAGGHRKHFDGENVALFCFQVDEDGWYAIYADVLGSNEASNAFVVRIDYFDPWVWDFPRSKEYSYQAVTSRGSEPVETELAAGQHVVGFHLHEPGARLDTVDIAAVRGGHPKRCEGSPNTEPPDTTTSSTEATKPKGNGSKGDGKPSTTSTSSSSTTVTAPSTTTTMPTTTTAPSTTTAPPATTVTTAASTTTTSVATTTTKAPLSAGSGVVWSAGMESGRLSEWAGVSSSSPGGSSTDYGVTSNLSRSGKYSLFMSIEDSVAGTGVRLRVDDNVSGYSGGQNLPDDAYYSAWYYIPKFVSLAHGDTWNIFQWKQTCQRNGGNTRCLLDWIKLVDLGDEYGFRLRSRTDDAGNWDPGNNNTLASNTDVTVRAGEWFHVESRRVYDSNFNGSITTWVNGKLVWDVKGIRTEHEGSNWDWTTPGAGWRRQWTVNNYNTGGHSPDTHTLYIDDAKIALNRQGP